MGAKRHCAITAVGAALLACFFSTQPAAAQTGGRATDRSDADTLARLRLIGMGEYIIGKQGAPPIGPQDVALCLDAMRRESLDVSSRGCLGFVTLGRYDFMATIERKTLDEIVDLLIARLEHDHEDTARWATRALLALGRRSRFEPSMAQPGVLQPAQIRRMLAKALAMAMRPEPQRQQGAGQLLGGFWPDVGPQMRSEIGRTVLAALARHERAAKLAGDAQDAARDVDVPAANATKSPAAEQREGGLQNLKRVLTVVPIQDAAIAAEAVRVLLADADRLPANHWRFYSKADCLRGIAGLLGALPRDTDIRKLAVAGLEAAAQDLRLTFMPTSGVRSPYQHHGAAAIERAVPAMTDDEIDRAAAALRKGRAAAVVDAKWGIRAIDLASMFDAADRAVAARAAARKLEKR